MRTSLFDIQINGFAGVDFQSENLDVAEVRRAVDALAAHETLRFFPTLITGPLEKLEAKFAQFENIRRQDSVVREAACGYHLEGPWLSCSPGFHGAHNPQYMGPPDYDAFQRLQAAAGGNIRLLTVAPEHPGSAEFIRKVVADGVAVSLGHTDAQDADIDAAVDAGARFCTHLGNGVPEMMHRHNNVIQRLLARDDLTAFFIPDGIHLPPFVLKNLFRAKPEGRVLFTTDCMAAAGAPNGTYRIGEMELYVGSDRVVRQPGGKGFAGSALTPDEGVANVARWLGTGEKKARALFSTDVASAFGISLPQIPS